MDDSEDLRLRQAWEQVLRRLSPEVPPAWNDRFIRPLAPHTLMGGVAVVRAPGRFVKEWIEEKYLDQLTEMLSDELGESVTIDVQPEPRDKAVASVVAPPPVHSGATTNEPTKFKPADRYSFDSFVVGQSNRMAVAGAKAVAAEPGTKLNPLFIYGASGLGKTHLLHSIAREILARDPRYPVAYISAQQFAEDFVNALQNNRIEQFRRSHRSVGVWLVDDIQFIAGKDKTMEEVFNTFNYLHSLGKQIVLCSDRPPRDLVLMDERLRSRFEAGLVADVQWPDTETRCAILLKKAELEDLNLTTDVAMYLAENVPGNIRKLEGALTKLAVQASLESRPIGMDLAILMVERYYLDGTLAKPSVNHIVDKVGKHYKIPADDIMGTSRKAPIVQARHVSIYLVRELTSDSWKHIGTLFGDRDHTSMMHAYQKIAAAMQQDRELRSSIKKLMRDLHPEA